MAIRKITSLVIGTPLLLTLSACGGGLKSTDPSHSASPSTSTSASASASSSASPSASASATPSASASTPAQTGPLTFTDAFVKAVNDGETSTAAFGTFHNSTNQDITITAVTSPSAPDVQLHTTEDDGTGQSTMQQTSSFLVPANGELKLEPGADHIMLMGLTKGIKAGDQVELDIQSSDGQPAKVTVPAKEFSGANETYESSSASAAPSESASGAASSASATDSSQPSDSASASTDTSSASPSASAN